MRCVGRNGFAFLFDRRDANFVTINQKAFKELERAVSIFRTKPKRRAR